MFKFVPLLVAVLVAASTAPAYAGGHPSGGGGTSSSTSGYDISYPQCNGSYPKAAPFGAVGVNNGIVFSPNPCLGTGGGPSELAWAQNTGKPAFYANTADPRPAYSSHWPFHSHHHQRPGVRSERRSELPGLFLRLRLPGGAELLRRRRDGGAAGQQDY